MATKFTYDDTKTAKENYDIFKKGQSESDYTLGAYTGTEEGDRNLNAELVVKVLQEEKKIASFNEAKQAAFDELAQKHNQERIELGQLWQAKEDAGYDVDHVQQ